MTVNDEFESVWKEAFVLCFNIVSQYLCGETEENHKNLVLDSWCLGQDSYPGYFRCKAVLSIIVYLNFNYVHYYMWLHFAGENGTAMDQTGSGLSSIGCILSTSSSVCL
jgi:hypothetical protein